MIEAGKNIINYSVGFRTEALRIISLHVIIFKAVNLADRCCKSLLHASVINHGFIRKTSCSSGLDWDPVARSAPFVLIM